MLRAIVVCMLLASSWGCAQRAAEPTARASEPTAPAGMAEIRIGADLSTSVARFLASRFSGDAVAHGDTVQVANRTLRIHAIVDKVVGKDGKFIVGLDVHCDLDGAPAAALYSGSLGIDDTREAAARESVAEWVGQYGIPVMGALLGKSDRALPCERFLVYPGPLGIRGDAPAEVSSGASLTDLHVRFLHDLEPSLAKWISPRTAGLHALTLTLVLRDGAATVGECRLDGQVSESLCDVAKAFHWPAPTTTYMLKQYYVLSPAPAVPKPNEPSRQ